ncbi:hypothetical protein NL676_020133 [Syzygium grande]|nr:hypothetical protein NL676_020133 [Syzygium grande]
MKSFSRAKWVTDPLDERARTRLLIGAHCRQLSYASSSSENDGEDCTTRASPSSSSVSSKRARTARECTHWVMCPTRDGADSVPTSRMDAEDVLARIMT